MKRLATVAIIAILTGCDRSQDPESAAGGAGMGEAMRHEMTVVADTVGLRSLPVPAEFARGRDLFTASCAECHGEAALGTTLGPPLVHIIYEPSHHADIAFVLAAERGVQAHHWGFGDMPPRPERSRAEVMEIVRYVRWLQREAGID